MQVGVAGYKIILYLYCRISEGSILLSVANPSIPIAVLSHSSLVVPILGLSHQEFVQKVLYKRYHNNIVTMVMLLGIDLRECSCCRNSMQIEPMGSLLFANQCLRDSTGAKTIGYC